MHKITSMDNYLEFCKVNGLNPSHAESLEIYYAVKEKEKKYFL